MSKNNNNQNPHLKTNKDKVHFEYTVSINELRHGLFSVQDNTLQHESAPEMIKIKSHNEDKDKKEDN